MSQIVIKRAGEIVRVIGVPEGGITVRELAQHLQEQRGGERPRPFDVVTVEAGAAPVAETEPNPRSCGG